GWKGAIRPAQRYRIGSRHVATLTFRGGRHIVCVNLISARRDIGPAASAATGLVFAAGVLTTRGGSSPLRGAREARRDPFIS
ncbi:hypothetical protein J8J40_28505, partial [Mycobacterium tuberculosis]|nr:hypothetical protein [Mycobacterium tuberculosis]